MSADDGGDVGTLEFAPSSRLMGCDRVLVGMIRLVGSQCNGSQAEMPSLRLLLGGKAALATRH